MTDTTALVRTRIGRTEILVRALDEGGISEAALGDLFDFGPVWRSIEDAAGELAKIWAKVRPDEAEVEFNVGCAVKSGQLWSFLAEGTGDASFKVTLKWTASEGS